MFYGMKLRYKLSGRVLDMMKYKRIINKKPRNFMDSEAFLHVRCEEV